MKTPTKFAEEKLRKSSIIKPCSEIESLLKSYALHVLEEVEKRTRKVYSTANCDLYISDIQQIRKELEQ